MPTTNKDPGPEILGPGEREVAILLACDLSKEKIAGRLLRPLKTIDAQVTNVYAKLGVGDRLALCRWTIRHGLIRHGLIVAVT